MSAYGQSEIFGVCVATEASERTRRKTGNPERRDLGHPAPSDAENTSIVHSVLITLSTSTVERFYFAALITKCLGTSGVPIRMAHSDFSISITDKAVDVSYTPSVSEPNGKLFGFIFTIATLIVLASAILFSPGKRGTPSMWHVLANASPGSPVVFIPFGLMLFIGLCGWQGFRYARAAWASDEIFHCDREAITVKRIPWLDFSNRTWRTYTYPLSEVSAIRFAVIASAKGRAFWGLRFRAHGRRWALPGLEAPEAKQILTGLRALGADVPDDPKLEKRIRKTIQKRFGDASWTDGSYINSNK